MNAKIFEIRDMATYIPVIAIRMQADNFTEQFYLDEQGFGGNTPVGIVRLNDFQSNYGSYKWNDRTMQTAHRYIESNFDTMKSGDVVDVEYILKETDKKKLPQRIEFNMATEIEKLLGY